MNPNILDVLFGPEQHNQYWRPAKVDQPDDHVHDWRPVAVFGLAYEICPTCRAQREAPE